MYSTGKEASVSKLILSLKYGGITLKGQFTDRFFFLEILHFLRTS